MGAFSFEKLPTYACIPMLYFVDQVKWAIGEVAFFEFDYELTKDEESRILKAFFAC